VANGSFTATNTMQPVQFFRLQVQLP